MAKDVVTFLNWAAEPEHDERKKYGLKAVILFSTLFAISLYVKRFKWTVVKNRKICELLPCTFLDKRSLNKYSLQPAGGQNSLELSLYLSTIFAKIIAVSLQSKWWFTVTDIG